MINEFEIPNGSRLYFGKIAKQKREIENLSVEILTEYGFGEIVTPYFSYHQALSNNKEIIFFSDKTNNHATLRADSASDVVRIITKRLGSSTKHKKWFYIQPIFKYPTLEINQIGAEWLGNNSIEDLANINIKLLDKLNITYTFQLGNIKIPELVSKECNIDMKHLKKQNIEYLLSLKIEWLDRLIAVTTKSDILDIAPILPTNIRDELMKIYHSADKINSDNIVVTPLFFANMEYYNELYFRCINQSLELISMGGNYEIENSKATGFAIYTDMILR